MQCEKTTIYDSKYQNSFSVRISGLIRNNKCIPLNGGGTFRFLSKYLCGLCADGMTVWYVNTEVSLVINNVYIKNFA